MSRTPTSRARMPCILLVPLAWILMVASTWGARGTVAVVVHRSNPLSEVSTMQLRRIYLGDQTRWSDNQKITILLLPQGSDERRTMLRVLLRMSEDDFTRHWISKVFRGESTAGPKTTTTAASILRLTADLPAALGILDADDVPVGTTTIKLLRIDGTAPGDDGYPLVR